MVTCEASAGRGQGRDWIGASGITDRPSIEHPRRGALGFGPRRVVQVPASGYARERTDHGADRRRKLADAKVLAVESGLRFRSRGKCGHC